ncbi:hypothetical protein ABES25_06140 [Bacillus gobiensis]|uniref:hypothetical protein n=1 Tax=Bacillus gobiensis TaxID=1441095 RepID=UPI003D1B07B8
MLKTFWKYALIILIVSLFPVVINLALYQKIFFGKGNDWLSFWGNYSGGLISAIVAYIVANSQIQKQQKLDLVKEKYARTINQLPALLRIKIELEKYIKELHNVKNEREGFIQRNGGIRKKAEEYDSPEEFFVAKVEGVPEYEINEKHYEMELPQSNCFTYLEKVENIYLHIDLITCFNFYSDFSKAMNYNIVLADKKWAEQDESIKGLISNGQFAKLRVLTEQMGSTYHETTVYYDKKKSCWETFYEEDMLSKFNEVFNRLDDEITNVKQIKETGDVSLIDKVGS